ncbi:class I SAM-dependent methyltransferase [Microcoleus sp. herbarium14]|uniref:class I SAM-dependent methyltransferase n=1 Tax=Microcoleus sp. herbarium14 TaxID=3055439 RepID=UPI002FD5DD03
METINILSYYGSNDPDDGILRLNRKNTVSLRERSSNQVEYIIKLLQIEKHDRVCDLGCGIGRHLLEFAKRGFNNLIGIDIDRQSISEAQKSLEAYKSSIEIITGDFTEIDFSCKFAYSHFGAFGYGEERDIVNDLRILYHKLEPNGGIFLDLVNRDFFLGHSVIDRWLYDDGTAILESAELDYASSLLRTKRKYVSIHTGEKDFYYVQRTFVPKEITDLLRAIGFSHVKCSSDERGNAVSKDRQRLLVCASR